MVKSRTALLTLLSLLAVSCVTTASSIIWQPKGGPSATLSLESEGDAGIYAAIRNVNGEYQADPWYLFSPATSSMQSPEILGQGKPADTVLLDAGAYDFELELYEAGGLLGKTGWREEKLPIRVKVLEADKRYTLILSDNLPVKGRADNAVASLSLFEQGMMDTLVQRWFITGVPEKGKENKLIQIYRYFAIVEDTELSFF